MSMRPVLGFTLVGLLLALGILAFAAMVALPAVAPTRSYKLELVASGFADAVRYARSEALRTGEPHGFMTLTSPDHIRVYRADMGTTPPTPLYDVYHPVSRRLYDLPLAELLTGAAMTRSATWNGTCNAPTFVTFDAEGTPHCGDPMAVLLEEGTITLSLGGVASDVVFSGPVGSVVVQ